MHAEALVSRSVCVCVFTFVYFFSRHSLHQCCRETWMSAGLTDREMGECRRGRMDGGERDEYWLISRKIDRQRIIAAFRLSLFFLLLLLFFPVANFPGAPIFALLRYKDCSRILEMILLSDMQNPGVFISKSNLLKPFVSLCLIGQARAKYFLMHENCMKPNHI